MQQTPQDSSLLIDSTNQSVNNGFSSMPINASTSVSGMRWRGIKSTENIGDGIAGSLFEASLEDGDFRYDFKNRKIMCYGRESKDFSFVPDWTGFEAKGEFVMHSGQLWRALGDTVYTQEPGFDPIREPVITYGSILPLNNERIRLYDGSGGGRPSGRASTPGDYQGIQMSGNFTRNGGEISGNPGYYIINSREDWGSRGGGTDVASRIQLWDGSGRVTISSCYRRTPTITASVTVGSITIGQGLIQNDTTLNVRQGYLKEGRKIRTQVYSNTTGSSMEDFLNMIRIF